MTDRSEFASPEMGNSANGAESAENVAAAQQPPVSQSSATPPPAMPPQAPVNMGPMPLNNNLGWAIGGLFVCWPFGIPALIKSLQVSSLWYQGQFAQAERSAGDAKKWGKLGVILGSVLLGLYMLGIAGYTAFMFWNVSHVGGVST